MSYKLDKNTVHSTFGTKIKVMIFGGSHEPVIGTTITGLPSGTEIDMDALQAFLERRAPGNSPFATSRKETDFAIAKEGLTDNGLADNAARNSKVTTGDPLTFLIENTNTKPADYVILADIPRPGHADFSAYMKYSADADTAPSMSGGGPFSARMTAPLCIAGGIALQLLTKRGISIGAHIYSIADVKDIPFETLGPSSDIFAILKKKDFPVLSESAEESMKEIIGSAKAQGDSVGGIVEACVTGLPAGLGGPMYDGIESVLSPILFGIPAVKGVEFGDGFASTKLLGSENNDAFYMDGSAVKTKTNHHGGILGGITSGMPLITRVAFKPTPSIAKEQDSVSLSRGENVKLYIKGRHDPCVAVRAVPIVEAALAIGLLDLILSMK